LLNSLDGLKKTFHGKFRGLTERLRLNGVGHALLSEELLDPEVVVFVNIKVTRLLEFRETVADGMAVVGAGIFNC
jgi:hypothetical protein